MLKNDFHPASGKQAGDEQVDEDLASLVVVHSLDDDFEHIA